jgi:succinate-acetate transporter protein
VTAATLTPAHPSAPPSSSATSPGSTGTVKFGGYVGLVTALVAFYASAAGISNGMAGRVRFPVGKPLIR